MINLLGAGFGEYFVALEFCDRSDGAIWWWCDVVVDSVRKPFVRRLFDLSCGVDFVDVGVYDRVCVIRLDFDQYLARLCLVGCAASLQEGWKGLRGPEVCRR